MRRGGLWTLVVSLCLPVAGVAQTSVARDAEIGSLPVQRVVLYKNGIGFFEHVGRVSGNETVSVTFTSAQLDDVLKSLTTVDLGGGRVSGITYDSTMPVERQLAALHLPIDGDSPSYYQLLDGLRGARVDVQHGARRATGRLLTVERQALVREDQQTSVHDEITVVTDDGTWHRFVVEPSLSVRVAEGDLRGRVDRYLDLMTSARAQHLRRVAISTSGTGARDLYVSYISEVPVWKSTYRLVLSEHAEEPPVLQGWAIVDNTVGEDWENVELSLVAGAPQSFVQSIAQPYYVTRPVIPLPTHVSTTPQTHEGTLAGDPDAVAEAPQPPPPSRPADAFRLSTPRGTTGGVVSRVEPETRDHVMGVAITPDASAQPVGELFEYRITDPITIRQNQSALVPILQGEVEAEKVALWNRGIGGAHPLSALWLANTSGLTLDGGSLMVIDGHAFAGEGVLDPLAPNEKRLVSYATDLGVRVDAREHKEDGRVARVRVANGMLIQQVHECSRWRYTVRNEDDKTRRVILEHPVRAGWTLQGSVAPVETTASAYRFQLDVGPSDNGSLIVDEARPVESRYEVSELTSARLGLLVRQGSLNGGELGELQRIVDKKQAIAEVQAEIDDRQATVDKVAADQERLRENMKALERSAEERRLTERYARQLNEQEDELARLGGELADLHAKRRALDTELRGMIRGLSLDVAGPDGNACGA